MGSIEELNSAILSANIIIILYTKFNSTTLKVGNFTVWLFRFAFCRYIDLKIHLVHDLSGYFVLQYYELVSHSWSGKVVSCDSYVTRVMKCLISRVVTKTVGLYNVSRMTVLRVMTAYTKHERTSSAKRNSGLKPKLTGRERRILKRIITKPHETTRAKFTIEFNTYLCVSKNVTAGVPQS